MIKYVFSAVIKNVSGGDKKHFFSSDKKHPGAFFIIPKPFLSPLGNHVFYHGKNVFYRNNTFFITGSKMFFISVQNVFYHHSRNVFYHSPKRFLSPLRNMFFITGRNLFFPILSKTIFCGGRHPPDIATLP